MLTTSQTQLVAMGTPDGEILCAECAKKHAAYETGEVCETLGELRMFIATKLDDGYTPYIEYDMGDFAPSGLYCDHCSKTLAEPECVECYEKLTDENTTLFGENKWGEPMCDECYRKQGSRWVVDNS